MRNASPVVHMSALCRSLMPGSRYCNKARLAYIHDRLSAVAQPGDRALLRSTQLQQQRAEWSKAITPKSQSIMASLVAILDLKGKVRSAVGSAVSRCARATR